MLFESGGDDYYGVIRTEVLRSVRPQGSFHHSDRTLVTELALRGMFYQSPDWLYFRRDHPDQAERANPTTRKRASNMDPRRASRLRHPAARIYGEYLWEYVAMIRGAGLPPDQRRECYRYMREWAWSRLTLGFPQQVGEQPAADLEPGRLSVSPRSATSVSSQVIEQATRNP
jgi:hypothetical protein